MSGDWKTDCRLFTGFSPCRHRRACTGCPHHDPIDKRVLLIQLDAMGDVLRTTAVLPAIRRAFPRAHVTWLTRRACAPLLAHNPLVDRVLVLGEGTTAVLGRLRFDVALCAEKSVVAGSLLAAVDAPDKRGFGVDDCGAIVPLGPDAEYLYRLGLDNHEKFFVNQRSEQRLISEAFGLPFRRDRYVLVLDDAERRQALDDRRQAGVGDNDVLVGWNTGCGPRYPYKRFHIDDQVELMAASWAQLERPARVRFVLLGGGDEDAVRNRAIASALEERGVPTLQAPCTEGLRRGISAVAACNMVVSGDTLALHLAIALRKPVVAWFGITCHQEIDVYGRGIKVLSEVGCRPCWLQSCPLTDKCYENLPWTAFAAATADMATCLVRDGGWDGEEIIGAFPPAQRLPVPLGASPGPVI